MKITIKDLLNSKLIKGLRIVGGANHCERDITDVNIMDNPDTIHWLKEGEFLLTTGYAIKDNNELQERLVKEMAELRCSGLAIKIKRYFDHIPKRMIELADEYHLPLLEIPYEYSLSTITSIVYKEILNKQTRFLQKSEEIHRNLTKVALRAGNLVEILHSVKDIINNPIIVLDSSWRLLGYSDDINNIFPIEKYLVLKKGHQVFSPTFFINIPKEIKHWERVLQKEYIIAGRPIVSKIYPIAANDTIYGYMVILECVRRLRKIDYIAIEHAGTIIALERIKAKAVEETKHQVRADFFDDLLCGKIESVNAIKSLSEIHGLDITKRYACMVIRLEYNEVLDTANGKIEEKERQGIKYDVRYAAEQVAYQYNRNLITIFRGNQVIALLQVEEPDYKYSS